MRGRRKILSGKIILALVLVVIFSFLIIFLFVFRTINPELHPESIAYSFRLPLDGDWLVSQEFAEWNSDWCGYHLAEDVCRSSEATVYAVADGVVRFAALAQLGYGYVVIIEHRLPPDNPVEEYVCTVYGHLREENLTHTRQIHKGEPVGHLSKNPEYNGGIIHLHFGIRKGRYMETFKDIRRGGWYYGGYTTIFGECSKSNTIHQQILDEWLNPTTDLSNGEGFINSHL